MVKAIPDGYHTVTPSLTFKDTQKAIEFYKKAFDAKVTGTFANPVGKGIMHATIQIGNSILMMGDENPNCPSAQTMGGSPATLFVYVPNVDAVFKKAVDAGGKVTMPIMEQFWGDRAGCIGDPFGYCWMIATHTRDLTQDQIKQGAIEFFANMPK